MRTAAPPTSPLLRTPTALTQKTDFGSGIASLSMTHAKATLSGALTANTYKSMVSVTGGGVLSLAAVTAVDTTSRDMAIRITLDGVVINTATTTATTVADRGAVGVGHVVMSGSTPMVLPQDLPFSTSCLIEIKSSLTETDKLTLYYALRI